MHCTTILLHMHYILCKNYFLGLIRYVNKEIINPGYHISYYSSYYISYLIDFS